MPCDTTDEPTVLQLHEAKRAMFASLLVSVFPYREDAVGRAEARKRKSEVNSADKNTTRNWHRLAHVSSYTHASRTFLLISTPRGRPGSFPWRSVPQRERRAGRTKWLIRTWYVRFILHSRHVRRAHRAQKVPDRLRRLCFQQQTAPPPLRGARSEGGRRLVRFDLSWRVERKTRA